MSLNSVDYVPGKKKMMNRAVVILKRIIVARLLLIGAALVLGSNPAAAEPDGSPWGENYFPNIRLLNQDGEAVYFYHDLIKDKIVVINFIFTNCEFLCSLETARLREVQSLLGDRVGQDIFIYSITIDPEYDTPSVLKQYAEKFGVAPGWQFLTGKEADIAYLRQKLGLFDLEEVLEAGPRDHSLSLMVGNEATGQWIKRSPHDNPGVLADLITNQISGGKVRRRDKRSYTSIPPIRSFSRGEYIFNTRCIACHTLGSGDGLGSDLLNVTARSLLTGLLAQRFQY